MKKVFAVALIALLLTACGAPSSIEGSWALELEGEEVIWTFDEGLITFTYQGKVSDNTGAYRYENGVLQLTLNEEWADYATYQCKLSGKKLTVYQEETDAEMVFVRVED